MNFVKLEGILRHEVKRVPNWFCNCVVLDVWIGLSFDLRFVVLCSRVLLGNYFVLLFLIYFICLSRKKRFTDLSRSVRTIPRLYRCNSVTQFLLARL